MSMDPVILGLLAGVVASEPDEAPESIALQMFEQVTMVRDASEGSDRTCYICIGKHCLYFVAKTLDSMFDGRRLSYLHIERAIIDPSTRCRFLLELVSDHDDANWEAGDRIFVESQHREQLLEHIGLCWQAETMFRKYEVRKFQRFVPKAGEARGDFSLADRNSNDHLQVCPFKEYNEEEFRHRGYGVFLRKGFRSDSGLRTGTFVHDRGWSVVYNAQTVVMPPKVQITIHVDDPKSIMELERSATGEDDLRTVAAMYKQAITEKLDQFYMLANNAYNKRMNRNASVASWDGWEFFVRGQEYAFACVIFRREYIPPLCDTVQDIAVLLRCPAANLTHDICEVCMDECHFVADTLASTADGQTYDNMIQARLDTLQCTEEAYRWLKGVHNLQPVHSRAATKFVKSIVKILVADGQLWDETIVEADVFRDVDVLSDPLKVAEELIADYGQMLGSDDKKLRDERRNSWRHRIARYLAYCVDGGIVGDRFTMGTLVHAMVNSGGDTDRVLKGVIEFLLQVVAPGDNARANVPLANLLQDPEDFGRHSFNERVMKLLLIEGFIANEWRRRAGSGTTYEMLLAALLKSDNVGIGLRTLICRQVLEGTSSRDAENAGGQVLVPALIKVMQAGNLNLSSCATAALVNLSCGKDSTKSVLVSSGCLKLCVRQLRAKDDDLTLYTLYLLVNLTKTAHHRDIFLTEGGMPLLVDILTSSYQNLRKQKILTELASVIGQLCNDNETRTLISDSFPVVPCLLWINDIAQPNTKLKAKLLFALRQLSVGENKIKVGKHAIPKLVEELMQATAKAVECINNTVLLLTMLARVNSNALMINRDGRLDDALLYCGLQDDEGREAKGHKFGPAIWDKVLALKERIREAEHGS